MEKIEKGQYGYINHRKKTQLIITGICFLVVFIVFFTGLIINNWDRNNIYTVAAIVLVLPSAKFAVSYLIVCNYKTPDKKVYNEITENVSNLCILSDCAIACKDKRAYVEFAIITDSCIYCYSNTKIDTKYFEDNVAEFIKSCGDTVNVKLIRELDVFINRIKSLNNVEMKENKIERVKKDFLILVL